MLERSEIRNAKQDFTFSYSVSAEKLIFAKEKKNFLRLKRVFDKTFFSTFHILSISIKLIKAKENCFAFLPSRIKKSFGFEKWKS